MEGLGILIFLAALMLFALVILFKTVRIVPLAELNVDDVDMLTVVIVGSSQTRTVATGDGRTWVYTPRGYAAKAGTAMRSGQ